MMNEPEKNAESSGKEVLVFVIKTQEKKCYTFAITFVTFPFLALTEPCFIVSVDGIKHVY